MGPGADIATACRTALAGSTGEVACGMKMFVELSAINLYKQPVDFRKSTNGLSAIAEAEMELLLPPPKTLAPQWCRMYS
ncbi:hypothetical protein [Pseudidiomarina insulisalsae]|uniref:hypothetical protein n=1 Tax=Pseudidiomarina insulisalsae TaxID=575789 RepID=UPI0018E56678|nr:hypothetical protein [Pseudidiomarina insulisalsae]